jgi:uncharacterized protein (DUF58 family)
MPSRYRFLDPKIISKLPSMQLVARLVVEGFITGIHRSPFHGFNVEFAEHRPYMQGDNIRYIDWKVFGKTDRHYIKVFEEETNLKCYILLDSSASMGYGSSGVTKLEYGSYLAASLSYLMLKQKDSVGFVAFENEIKKFLPPKGTAPHVSTILDSLEGLRPAGKTNISDTLHGLAERITRRGLIILISDLFDDKKEVMAGLKHFRHKHHEVIVFHLLDRDELKFPFQNPTIFRDMENFQSIHTEPERLKEEYLRRVEEFIDFYKRGCYESYIDYVMMDTSQPLDGALMQYLNKRRMVS